MARGRPAAHLFVDLPMSAGGLTGCRTMQTAAVGSTRVNGVREACLLAAVLVAASGALPAHASQPPQPPAEVDSAQSSDPAASEQAPEPADEQPAQPDAADAAPPADAAEADAEQPADAEEAEPPAGTFEAPAGLILSYIKSEGSGDFERVMTRIGAALASSEDEERRELLSGWRLYRAREPGPEGEVLYVWLIDPAVAGADYAVPELLGAALPDESQALFDAFSAAFGSGQALINLEPVDIVPASPE